MTVIASSRVSSEDHPRIRQKPKKYGVPRVGSWENVTKASRLSKPMSWKAWIIIFTLILLIVFILSWLA